MQELSAPKLVRNRYEMIIEESSVTVPDPEGDFVVSLGSVNRQTVASSEHALTQADRVEVATVLGAEAALAEDRAERASRSLRSIYYQTIGIFGVLGSAGGASLVDAYSQQQSSSFTLAAGLVGALAGAHFGNSIVLLNENDQAQKQQLEVELAYFRRVKDSLAED